MAVLASLVQLGPETARSTYSAQDDRYRFAALAGQTTQAALPREGVVWSASSFDEPLQVRQQTTANMTVRVSAGQAILRPSVTTAAGHVLTNNAVLNLSIAAAHTTNGRIDRIVAKVYDEDFGDSQHGASVYVITGSASSTPTVPNGPTTGAWMDLAWVTVNAGQSSVTTSHIADKRQFTTSNGGVIYAPTDLLMPSLAVKGQLVWLASRNTLVVWNGSNWAATTGAQVGTQAWRLASTGQPGTPPAGAILYPVVGTRAVSTNTSSVLAFGLPFTGGIATINVSPGDSASAFCQAQIDYASSAMNSIIITCRTQGGTPIANQAVRVNFDAWGWD